MYTGNCEVFNGASQFVEGEVEAHKGDAKQDTKVVKKFVDGLCNQWHNCMVDKFFTRIELFCKLEHKILYCFWLVKNNRISCPKHWRKPRFWLKKPQSTLDWRMHGSRKMIVFIWMDKKTYIVTFYIHDTTCIMLYNCHGVGY